MIIDIQPNTDTVKAIVAVVAQDSDEADGGMILALFMSKGFSPLRLTSEQRLDAIRFINDWMLDFIQLLNCNLDNIVLDFEEQGLAVFRAVKAEAERARYNWQCETDRIDIQQSFGVPTSGWEKDVWDAVKHAIRWYEHECINRDPDSWFEDTDRPDARPSN